MSFASELQSAAGQLTAAQISAATGASKRTVEGWRAGKEPPPAYRADILTRIKRARARAERRQAACAMQAPNVQSEPRGSDRVGSTVGSAAATRESRWRIRISDCYCEYEYELIARVDDVCIHDLYELVRERLKANDVHGRFVDPEEYSSPNMEVRDAGSRKQ